MTQALAVPTTSSAAPRPRSGPRPRTAPRAPQRAAAVAGTTRLPARVYRRRRLGVLGGLVALTLLLTFAVGFGGADAALEDRVAGHAVIAPGDTLWDVAVEHAPDGVDPRAFLADLRDLNGLDDGAAVPAWTVVLLPAR